MIANFSSFIEFLAAIYVTMCLDNQICRNFWTPDYFNSMRTILEGYDFEGSSNLFQKLQDGINNIYVRISNLSQKKGGFMLGFCVWLLILIGLEEQIKNELWGYIPFLLSCFYVFVIVLFSKFILCKWKFVISALLGLLATFLLSYIYANQIFQWIGALNLNLLDYKYFVFVIVLLLPILHQLWVNWIYSSVYKGYLKKQVELEYEKYKRSKEGIEKRKKGIIDPEYLEAWNDQYFKNEDSDQSLTIFNRVLYYRLLKIASPSIWRLSWSLLCHWTVKIYRIFNKKKEVMEVVEDNSLDANDILSIIPKENVKLDFSKEYSEYRKWKKDRNGKNASIKVFCAEKTINAKDMIAWLRVNKPTD